MTRKKKATLLHYGNVVLMLLGVLSMMSAVESHNSVMWTFFAVCVVAFIVTGILSLQTNYCPHCDQWTNMVGPSSYCPKCGEWIPFGDNDKPPSNKKKVAEQVEAPDR
ncbi:hypothetical protein JIN77_16625 [Verrucomicrobiaceae bacterium R5-34]|nr:hypothetical protein [Verrucomicrobiaceae bacterium R5-34]